MKKQQNAIVPYKQNEFSTKSELDNQKNVDLVAVSQKLAQQAQNANSTEEIQQVVNVLPVITHEWSKRDIQEITYLQEKERLKSISFERNLKAVKEGFRITASIASVTIGLYLLTSTPLLSPLLITLGIAGALNYQLKDVTELASKINPSTRNFDGENYDEIKQHSEL